MIFFVIAALSDANDAYSRKLASGKATQQTLFSLGWRVDELSRLISLGRKLLVDCKSIRERHACSECDALAENIPRQLTDLRSRAVSFIEGCTRMRRIPATHLLVFMISPESRDKKPYAIPVQCIPYSGMSQNTICGLANHLIAEMTSRGMKVAGMFCMGINKMIWYFFLQEWSQMENTMAFGCVETHGLFMCYNSEQRPKQKVLRQVSKVY